MNISFAENLIEGNCEGNRVRIRRSMRAVILIISTLMCIATSGAAQTSSPPASAPQSQPQNSKPRKRVVLMVNRNLETAGYLELDSDDVIAIRNVRGEVESFPKSHVAKIIHLVDPQPGQTGVVVLRNGQTREGLIIEDAFDYVLIEIQGIRAKLKREDVSHVVLTPTFEERYAQAKANLQPGMHDAHFALCQWLFDQRRYELARQELRDLLNQVDMPEAISLMKLVEAQLAMQKPTSTDSPASTQPGSSDQPDGADDARRRAGPVYPADLLPTELISSQDVNLIRVYEIDFEHSTRVTITPDTVRELIEKYGTNKLIPASQTGRTDLFRSAADRPLDVVRLMFALSARDLYPKIQVNSEPYALNLFRQRVHDTWLINTCGTNQCHGGPFAGRFFVHRKNFKDDRVRFTNLLILERLNLDPEWPLINYDKPEDSLLIQYGMPRDAARKPHPPASGWKPAFSPLNPRLKEDAINWIQAMMQPRPDYPVKYSPPKLGANKPDAGPAGNPAKPPR